MTLASPPDEADIVRLRAAEEAVSKLGEDAMIDELEIKMSDNGRRFVPPELKKWVA